MYVVNIVPTFLVLRLAMVIYFFFIKLSNTFPKVFSLIPVSSCICFLVGKLYSKVLLL